MAREGLTLSADAAKEIVRWSPFVYPDLKFTVRLFKGLPEADQDGDPSQCYTVELEPLPGPDGSVPVTSGGCVEGSKVGTILEPACHAYVILDTTGCGKARAVCPRHGTRHLPRKDVVGYACLHRHNACSLKPPCAA